MMYDIWNTQPERHMVRLSPNYHEKEIEAVLGRKEKIRRNGYIANAVWTVYFPVT